MAITKSAKKAIRSSAKKRVFNQRRLKTMREEIKEVKDLIIQKSAQEALKLLSIDELGLGAADRTLISILIEKFGGGPVGLNTLAAASSEEEATIEEVHEPYLIQLGLLERTPRGRRATVRAYQHAGIEAPASLQEKLL